MTVLLLVVAATVVGLGAGGAFLLAAYVVVTIRGRSMEPVLRDGDRVLVRRRHARRLTGGDVIVLRAPAVQVPSSGSARHEPVGGLHVKRVAALPGDPMPRWVRADTAYVPDGALVVLSDNTDRGTDSRQWGPYPAAGLVGVVVRRLSSRRGRR